jgi:hypothetical protein
MQGREEQRLTKSESATHQHNTHRDPGCPALFASSLTSDMNVKQAERYRNMHASISRARSAETVLGPTSCQECSDVLVVLMMLMRAG